MQSAFYTYLRQWLFRALYFDNGKYFSVIHAKTHQWLPGLSSENYKGKTEKKWDQQ